jgi:hypothetical protein
MTRSVKTLIGPAWQGLKVGDIIPDYGGAHETFQGRRDDRSQRPRLRVAARRAHSTAELASAGELADGTPSG